ncbi:hypothetical protein [Acinetobacter baumannii]|uniref:hypothetical protein n=1 Tax=Acinetobacter baumannii TaxID=470 RepID=UPI0037BF4939
MSKSNRENNFRLVSFAEIDSLQPSIKIDTGRLDTISIEMIGKISVEVGNTSNRTLSLCIDQYLIDRDKGNLHLWQEINGELHRVVDEGGFIIIAKDQVEHFKSVVNFEF